MDIVYTRGGNTMFKLFKNRQYRWINSLESGAENNFAEALCQLVCPKDKQLVFLCIGTPLLSGDSLGPTVGSYLKDLGVPSVYGTLQAPVHAENIELYRKIIKKMHQQATIIAIDAAIGDKNQSGYITIRKGALHPGSALGKPIRPIGHIEITGVFENISHGGSESLTMFMSQLITDGLGKLQMSL